MKQIPAEETVSNRSERKYKVLLKGKDKINIKQYLLQGGPGGLREETCSRHEILFMNDQCAIFFDAHPRRWEIVVFHLVVVLPSLP